MSLIFCQVFAVLVFLSTSTCDDMKSLQEAIEVVTGDEFNNLYEEKSSSATKLLELFHSKTNIKEDYLNTIFLEATEVQELKDLDGIQLDMHEAIDLAKEVIKHFQKNPMAGRKEEL